MRKRNTGGGNGKQGSRSRHGVIRYRDQDRVVLDRGATTQSLVYSFAEWDRQRRELELLACESVRCAAGPGAITGRELYGLQANMRLLVLFGLYAAWPRERAALQLCSLPRLLAAGRAWFGA